MLHAEVMRKKLEQLRRMQRNQGLMHLQNHRIRLRKRITNITLCMHIRIYFSYQHYVVIDTCTLRLY